MNDTAETAPHPPRDAVSELIAALHSPQLAETPALRIATDILGGTLVKALGDLQAWGNGAAVVELVLFKACPQDTPADFAPANDLEALLFAAQGPSVQKIHFVKHYDSLPFVRGLRLRKSQLESTYDADLLASANAAVGGVQVELHSRRLSRSLYMFVYSG